MLLDFLITKRLLRAQVVVLYRAGLARTVKRGIKSIEAYPNSVHYIEMRDFSNVISVC
jgi:hypothetical protein